MALQTDFWLPPSYQPHQRSQNNLIGNMQSAEAKLNKSFLLLALRRYNTAVQNMEHTILLPSLLRDVPSDYVEDCDAAEGSCKDLYDDYLMVKAIRNKVESGLVPLDELKDKAHAELHTTLGPLLEVDPEALFYFHLRGLFTVMVSLTKKSQSLTTKYLDIIGVAN